MEASVKVQSTASVRTSAAGRLPSVDTSAGGSGFRQLLQVKKDAADVKGQNQTDKSGKPDSINQTDKKTSESDEAGKVSESKKDETKVPDNTADSEDAACQEALQRAALEQAAAQMVGMVQEEPGAETLKIPAAESVQGIEQTGQQTAEVLAAGEQTASDSADMIQNTGQQMAAETMTAKKPIQKDGAEKPAEPVKESENPSEGVSRVRQPAAEDNRSEVKADTSRQQGQDLSDSGSENGRRIQQTEDGSTQQMAGAGAFRVSGQQEPMIHDTRGEQIPLKTTPDTLPEDLGKTLAAKLPDAGKTLTVELEPASLGKLTIRLTYEAGRTAVSILATNPRTLELLNSKAAEIASILEEKTGQETVILTQEPHEQEQYQESKHGSSQQEEQEQGQQRKEEPAHQSDSFAQQLRLGLV